MGVELRPLSVKCNSQYRYCYQKPHRDVGNVNKLYNLNKMKVSIEEEVGPFMLSGGEPLLIPIKDLEELWAWGLERFGSNSVQTNGILITDEHIQLFKKYRVNVGISLDGPGKLNGTRWMGTLERTCRNTRKAEKAIEHLCREGISVSITITLNRNNASANKLPVLCDWIRYLVSIRVQHMHLYLVESESPSIRKKYGLSDQENIEALRTLFVLGQELSTVEFDVFLDMRHMLLGEDIGGCAWNACDPYTTIAVQGIEGNGRRSNCGRNNQEGIDFIKADKSEFERYLSLYWTPYEYGGCNGCRFFLMCKGQCPGTAIGGDWRNRTEYCKVWKTIFTDIEERLLKEGLSPITCNPCRSMIEKAFLNCWSEGRNTSISAILRANPEFNNHKKIECPISVPTCH